MIYTYDPVADALYVRLSDRQITTQVELSDGVIVDVDVSGVAVGVDVMAPDRDWATGEIIERFALDVADADLLRALASTKWRVFPLSTGDASENVSRGIPQLVSV